MTQDTWKNFISKIALRSDGYFWKIIFFICLNSFRTFANPYSWWLYTTISARKSKSKTDWNIIDFRVQYEGKKQGLNEVVKSYLGPLLETSQKLVEHLSNLKQKLAENEDLSKNVKIKLRSFAYAIPILSFLQPPVSQSYS